MPAHASAAERHWPLVSGRAGWPRSSRGSYFRFAYTYGQPLTGSCQNGRRLLRFSCSIALTTWPSRWISTVPAWRIESVTGHSATRPRRPAYLRLLGGAQRRHEPRPPRPL